MPDHSSSVGRARQSEIYLGGIAGRVPAVPVSYARLVRTARRAMTKEAFA